MIPSYTNSLTLQGVIRFVIGFTTVGIALFLLWYFSDVVIYILVSAVLAIMFRPMVNALNSIRIKKRVLARGFAALITLLVIWILFLLLFSLLVPLIFSKIYQLTNIDFNTVLHSIQEPVLYVQHYIQNLLSIPESNVDIGDSLIQWGKNVIDMSTINGAFSSIIGLLASSVITFFSVSFITFFFLKDENLFFSMVSSMFPSKYDENVKRALNSISFLLSRYFVGLLAESSLIAISVSVAMICFGMKPSDAFFIGIIMGVMNVVPYAGPFMGACFSVFLGVVTPIESLGIGSTVCVIIGSLAVIKGIDDFVLQPTLYSERVKAHPLEVFIVILLSGYVAGIVGMLLAIPSYTVLRVFGKEFFSQYSLVQKLTKEL
ncbi:MAG: AI-2E family transporter [Rikenellaceae bacterium]